MLKEKRQEQIMELLHNWGSAEITQLCDMFNVTNMTIRRDLADLESTGQIARTHGGAVLVEQVPLFESFLEQRLQINRDKKYAIGKMACDLITSGQKLFISSGSTTQIMVNFLDNSRRLVVVTNSLHVALDLTNRNNISTIIIGGEVRSNTRSTSGALAEATATQFKCVSAYISVSSIDGDGNLYLGSMSDLGICTSVLKNTDNVIILADSSKIGLREFVIAGKLCKGYTLITNKDADETLIANYRDMGVNVILTTGAHAAHDMS